MGQLIIHLNSDKSPFNKNAARYSSDASGGYLEFSLVTGDSITVFCYNNDKRTTLRALAELFAEPLKQMEQEEMALAHEEECKRVIDSAYAETPGHK